MINRVVDTITRHGIQEKYFENATEAEDFREELKYILATQRAAFNSPVWFNIGAPDRAQQASACFILGIEDTMPAILNWYKEEGMIFKGGSGSGINLSGIRSSVEPLGKSAGTASGPLSFMRGADSSAGAIKSGGKTRRAAKMVILNVDHPDVDEFMQAVEDDKEWDLRAVKTGESVKTLKARELLREFAQAAWECADPGMQFDTTINYWHTTPNAGRINGSNPCSEYMHLDDSACNLASINLLKISKG